MRGRSNELLNKIEIALGREKSYSLPRWVQVEPTNLCNQKCIMCPRNTHMDSPLGSMSFENFKRIYEQIPTIKELQLNGLGEPLLNLDIFKMIKYAKEKGSFTVTTSNCELMTEEKANELVKSGLGLLKISMDTTDPEYYKQIRNGNLDRALHGIKNIVTAKKELNSKIPIIWFNSIIMKDNYTQLPDIIKLGDSLGIDFIRFKPIGTYNVYEDEELKVENEILFKTIGDAIQLSQGCGVGHNLTSLFKNKDCYYRPINKKYPCYSPWLEVYIQWYGGVRLCCEFFSSKYDLGNIFEQDFQGIWNGGQMRNIRKLFIKGNTNFPVCKTCNRSQRNINIYNKIRKFGLNR